MPQLQKIERIPQSWAFLMIGVALLFDLLQLGFALIPLAGWLVSSAVACIAFLTFFLWFNFRGVNYNSSRKIAISGFSFLVEFIPLLGSIAPASTISTILMILVVKREDLFENQKIKYTSMSAQPTPSIQKSKAQQQLQTVATNATIITRDERLAQESYKGKAHQNLPLANKDWSGITSLKNNEEFKKSA